MYRAPVHMLRGYILQHWGFCAVAYDPSLGMNCCASWIVLVLQGWWISCLKREFLVSHSLQMTHIIGPVLGFFWDMYVSHGFDLPDPIVLLYQCFVFLLNREELATGLSVLATKYPSPFRSPMSGTWGTQLAALRPD